MTKRLVVIDGKSVFYRGYYAMPGLTLGDGTPSGGVFGFASIAIEIIKQLNPDYITVAWDIKGTSTAKRSELYPEYKAGRTKPPEDFYAQLPILREVLDAFGWPLYELDGYEADDIMGTFAAWGAERDIETCLVTGDYDMLQLIAPTTKVYITKRGGTDLTEYDATAFTDKYGVRVDQFVDYKALIGDKSDNIPGVRKVGPKAAEKLLGEYETLTGIYDHLADLKGALHDNLEADRGNAFLSQKLAQIFTDAPIEPDLEAADVHMTRLDRVAAVLRKFEFSSLVKRLPEHMQQTEEHALYIEDPHDDLEEIAWPEQLTINEPVVLHIDEQTIWLSTDGKTVMKASAHDVDVSVWRALEFAEVIAYDLKELYHRLAALDVYPRFEMVHDVRQAAFLIDPLRRDRGLEALIGHPCETPHSAIRALREIYGWQHKALDELPRVAEIARQFDFPLIYHLFMMEHEGIKLDKALLKTMSEEVTSELATREQEMYTMVGYEFNIGSPAQLSEVLFTKLQLSTTGIKRGKTSYSTDQKTLDKLKGQHPIIELIEKTRELAKLKNTYIDTLPEQTDTQGRLHTTFNQDVAATGRLSSTNPNLQNIPVRSDLGRRIREAFVPEKGNVFVSADYSQFELRLAAILSGDTQLIEDFNGDIDIHTKTASDVYGIPMEQVTKNQRRDAKVINFGVLYGMSPHGLAAATGMGFGEAKRFIDQYFELRAPVRKFIDATLHQAKTEGYVETYFGRRRPTPDINSSNFIVRQAAERAAANMPIQGTEADLMKRAMIAVDGKLKGHGEQLLQIHDSILVECPKKEAEYVAEVLKSTMESIAPELAISLRVDVTTGSSWGEL